MRAFDRRSPVRPTRKTSNIRCRRALAWPAPMVLQCVTSGTILRSLRLTRVDDGGRDETKPDLLLLPDDFGPARLLSAGESSTRILHCAEFADHDLHRR